VRSPLPPPARRLDRGLRTAGRLLALILILLVALAACGGPAATAKVTFSPGAIVITAKNIAFDRTELFLPADRSFPLVLVNEDVDPHNVAIRTQRGFEGELLFRMDTISATTVEVPAGPFAEGTYFFICDVHPVMNGTVIVQ
jgi:hypothetical protein